MSTHSRAFLAFVIPGGIIFSAAIGFLRPHGLPASVQVPVHAFPFIVMGFGLFFGWYLSSSRLILSFLVLMVADRALSLSSLADSDPASTGRLIFATASFLVPLNILALSLIKDETISAWRCALQLALIVVQPLLILWLARSDQTGLALALQKPLLPVSEAGWTTLAQPALFAFGTALLLIIGRYVSTSNPMDSGTFWALLLSFTAFQHLHQGWSLTSFLSAAGLILFLALVQDTHRRNYRDDLTGVPGRRAYEEVVASLGKKFVLAVIGIDQLKRYGSQHGKSISEQVLRLVAPTIMSVCKSGKVFRLAGEEFTVLFSKKTAVETLAAVEEIRKAVEQMNIYLGHRDRVLEGVLPSHSRSGQGTLAVTVSIGLAETGEAGASLELVTKAAYRALYEAKGAGGNLVNRGDPVPETRTPAPSVTGRIVASREFEDA